MENFVSMKNIPTEIDQSLEGNNRVRDFERRIQQGAWRGVKPLLNPI